MFLSQAFVMVSHCWISPRLKIKFFLGGGELEFYQPEAENWLVMLS